MGFAKQQFFLDGNALSIELDRIAFFGTEVWVNAVNVSGETPLHIVAGNRNLRLFLSMLPYYTDIEATNKAGNTVSHLLVDHKVERFQEIAMQRIDLLRILISKGADVNRPNKRGWTLAHFAAKHCHVDMMTFLEKNGADFDTQTSVDGTTLLMACKHMLKNPNSLDETKTIDFLLDSVYNINATDEEGYSALHYAVERCSSTTVMKLLNRNADLHLRTKEHNLTPLQLAVTKDNNLPIVQILLKAGANVESPEIDESTPLHISLLAGPSDVVEYLIKCKADVNRVEKYLQFTPLHLAIYKQRFDLIQLLLENGVDVNGSGEDGLTPLHFSSMLGCLKSTKTLISHGAKVNCNYNNRLTPLYLAWVKNHSVTSDEHDKKRNFILKLLSPPRDIRHYGAIIDMLLHQESNPNALTRCGWNFLHFVVKLGPSTDDFVKVLYEHAANFHCPESNLGLTPLHFALASNFKDIVEVLIKAGADVNAVSQNGQRPIHLALRSDGTEMLKLLINHGAVVDCKETYTKLTPLHLAINKRFRDAAEVLINSGADVNSLTQGSRSPMCLALEWNCMEVLNTLISRGANVNFKELRSQMTLLHLSLLRNNRDTAEILINAGADVNALTKDGKSPIHLELESHSFKGFCEESTQILKLLLDHGANVNYKETHSQLTPLQMALCKKYEDAAMVLINAAADVNTPTRDGKSPLHLALEMNCIEVLKLLISRSANVNHKEPHLELTPLHVALLKNHRVAIEILVAAGADVNALTQNGLRPIHLALMSNCAETLKLLLEKGAYVDAKEVHSKLTPLHLALYKNYTVAAEIFIEAGADVNIPTVNGKSPLHLALESNCMGLVKMMVDRGATLNCKGKRCLYTLLYVAMQQKDDDMINELCNLKTSLIFRVLDSIENEGIKRAIVRLCAIIDAFNENSCMDRHFEVDKRCEVNSACHRKCRVDHHEYYAYIQFISYRVLSGTFREFIDEKKANEVDYINADYLCNYLTVLDAIDSPLARSYKTMKLGYASGFFDKLDIKSYNVRFQEEVDRLKEYKISNSVTLYDVLRMEPKQRGFYMKNINIFQIQIDFQIYYKLVLAYYHEEKIKSVLMNTTQWAFFRLTNSLIPNHIAEEIFLNLDVIDMIAMIEAAERVD